MEGSTRPVVLFYVLDVILGLQQVPLAASISFNLFGLHGHLSPVELMENLDLICEAKDRNTMQWSHPVPGSQPHYTPSSISHSQAFAWGWGWGGQREQWECSQAGLAQGALAGGHAKWNRTAGPLPGFPTHRPDRLSSKLRRKLGACSFC